MSTLFRCSSGFCSGLNARFLFSRVLLVCSRCAAIYLVDFGQPTATLPQPVRRIMKMAAFTRAMGGCMALHGVRGFVSPAIAGRVRELRAAPCCCWAHAFFVSNSDRPNPPAAGVRFAFSMIVPVHRDQCLCVCVCRFSALCANHGAV